MSTNSSSRLLPVPSTQFKRGRIGYLCKLYTIVSYHSLWGVCPALCLSHLLLPKALIYTGRVHMGAENAP